ncbi:MAG: alanine racemase, partial [Firmicutes bacterium]|nr:alanine racemase [Bacillota bacterium]
MSPAEVIIDLDALAYNLRLVKERCQGSPVLAMVKGDAYGHGLVECARALVAAGSERLGVARMADAVSLRKAGVTVPVHVLAPCTEDDVTRVVLSGAVVTVNSADVLSSLAAEARLRSSPARVEIEVDSGLHRSGLPPDAAVKLGEVIGLLGPDVRLEGVYTHFSSADCGDSRSVSAELEVLKWVIRRLGESGVRPARVHAAGSAAAIYYPETRLDLVRPGICLYGYLGGEPFGKRVMTVYTRIVELRRIRPGERAGYGGTFRATRETTVATVPVGYGDGLPRVASGAARAAVRGWLAPAVGEIFMHHTLFDVTEIPSASLGDPVTIIGGQGDGALWASDWANWAGTVTDEILCRMGSGMPRRYVKATWNQ